MKKTITLLIFTISFFANAQYFEGFENGVPGTMTQTYNKGETTWINFGISAVYVDNALSENNSAVFADGMASDEVDTSLQTPVLDLSQPQTILEFKYLQKQRNKEYANVLFVELSNDMGKSWNEIGKFNKTSNKASTIRIDLNNFKTSNKSIIRFRATQTKSEGGYPIVIDDISVTKENKESITSKINDITNNKEVKVFPNPSSGIFTIVSSEPIEITVTDVNGRTIFNKKMINETQIDLSQYTTGIYFAKLKGTTIDEVKKLLIK